LPIQHIIRKQRRLRLIWDDYITELNLRQFANNTTQYLTLTRTIRRLNQINVMIILNLIALSIVIVLRMIQKMVKPIRKLAAAADALSEGNYEIADIYVQSEDEIHVLAQTFNEMKHNIKRYINEVENKAVTEKKLLDQQLENLKMHHLLDNAKLYALQSQINPHFLYNTMNAALQMANIEEAERTSDILETIANLFRYMVRELKSEVTLRDELDHIEHFKKLLQIRFGDRIALEMAIEPKTLTTIMPPLILQPLVENAYLHGLGKMEEGGLIRITSCIKDHVTWITVEDNGEGMDDERVKDILDGTQTTRGIAMKNVMERLFLFYGHEDSVHLSSIKGQGTKVSLRLGQARRTEHV
jgi:two-component system, sensor histidine kinase YesM